MDPKILVLVVVSVFAFAPEFTNAARPAFCNELATPVYLDESKGEKWTFNPKQNKCRKVLWAGDTTIRNYFDTETACLKTCQPEKTEATKPWILVGGRCLCRCPKCDANDATVKTKSKMTPKPTVVSTTTTTEASLLKQYFGM